MTSEGHTNDKAKYKVGNIIETYSLEDMGADLESRWLGEGAESQSLRELADYFNRSVLRKTLKENGWQALDREVENIYETLTNDDLSSGEKMEIRRSLEHEGVDIDQLKQDFVTHQAIHSYLTKGRGADKEYTPTDRVESVRKSIQRLKSRLTAVTESSLSRLRDTDTITLGDFDVLVDLSVVCSDCGKHMSISELLEEGGCDCD
jgi:hypothetical protein